MSALAEDYQTLAEAEEQLEAHPFELSVKVYRFAYAILGLALVPNDGYDHLLRTARYMCAADSPVHQPMSFKPEDYTAETQLDFVYDLRNKFLDYIPLRFAGYKERQSAAPSNYEIMLAQSQALKWPDVIANLRYLKAVRASQEPLSLQDLVSKHTDLFERPKTQVKK